MKCKKCRKIIPDGSKFCNHCGTPLTAKQKLYRRPDGLYEKIMTIGGKRVAFRAKKEADVYKKIREYEEKKERGMMFVDVADKWESEHRQEISDASWASAYAFPFEEIKEYFADDYINDITHKDIAAYMRQLPRTYARKTCATRLNIINMIFKYAVIEEIVTDNPCSYITVPKGHGAKKRSAPTQEEIDIIKDSLSVQYKNLAVGFLALFLLYTGCRKGEALALTFGDIDREKKRIKITKSVYYTSNEPHLKKPKTEAGEREIIIPDYLLARLPSGKKSELIFSQGGNLMKKNFYDNAWEHYQKKNRFENNSPSAPARQRDHHA
jgi:integrase